PRGNELPPGSFVPCAGTAGLDPGHFGPGPAPWTDRGEQSSGPSTLLPGPNRAAVARSQDAQDERPRQPSPPAGRQRTPVPARRWPVMGSPPAAEARRPDSCSRPCSLPTPPGADSPHVRHLVLIILGERGVLVAYRQIAVKANVGQ